MQGGLIQSDTVLNGWILPDPRYYLLTCIAGLSLIVADAVDDVMRDFGVLRHGEHVVPGAGDGVPDQEHAVPLALQ